MDDYQRGVADERARIRTIVSANAAEWAARAGISIDALEAWIARGMPDDESFPEVRGPKKGRKARRWMAELAAAHVGLLRYIDGE